MRDLTSIRQDLDKTDRVLVGAMEARMRLCEEIADFKHAHHLPILDTAREEQVLASRAAMLENPGYAEDLRCLYREIMRLSRLRQARWMEETP